MKTYDPDVDALLAELCNPYDTYSNYIGYVKVVDAEVAERAAKLIFKMYERLSAYDAEDYNRQMGCE